MAISYPLTPPAAIRIARITLTGSSAVSRNVSPFTFNVQQYNWTGSTISGQVECPPMTRADAEELLGFLLMAARGTFVLLAVEQTSRGRVTLLAYGSGGYAVLHVAGRRKSRVPGLVARPYKIRRASGKSRRVDPRRVDA